MDCNLKMILHYSTTSRNVFTKFSVLQATFLYLSKHIFHSTIDISDLNISPSMEWCLQISFFFNCLLQLKLPNIPSSTHKLGNMGAFGRSLLVNSPVGLKSPLEIQLVLFELWMALVIILLVLLRVRPQVFRTHLHHPQGEPIGQTVTSAPGKGPTKTLV